MLVGVVGPGWQPGWTFDRSDVRAVHKHLMSACPGPIHRRIKIDGGQEGPPGRGEPMNLSPA